MITIKATPNLVEFFLSEGKVVTIKQYQKFSHFQELAAFLRVHDKYKEEALAVGKAAEKTKVSLNGENAHDGWTILELEMKTPFCVKTYNKALTRELSLELTWGLGHWSLKIRKECGQSIIFRRFSWNRESKKEYKMLKLLAVTPNTGPKYYDYSVETWKFPAGETGLQHSVYPYYGEPAKLKIVCNFESNDDLINLLLLNDALRESFGLEAPIDLYIPYFPYARQDRRMCDGQSNSLRAIVNLIRSCKFNQVEVVDPHSDVLSALFGPGELKVISQLDAIKGSHIIQNYINFKEKTYIVAPDAGALKKIYQISGYFGLPVIQASKNRDVVKGTVSGTVVQDLGISDPVNLLVIDDIIDGGRTFIELAKELRKVYNVKRLGLWASHGIFSKGVDVLKDYDDIDVFNNMSQFKLSSDEEVEYKIEEEK